MQRSSRGSKGKTVVQTRKENSFGGEHKTIYAFFKTRELKPDHKLHRFWRNRTVTNINSEILNIFDPWFSSQFTIYLSYWTPLQLAHLFLIVSRRELYIPLPYCRVLSNFFYMEKSLVYSFIQFQKFYLLHSVKHRRI